MSDSFRDFIFVLVVFVCAVLLFSVGVGCGYSIVQDSAFERGYIAACVDIRVGKCKYELKDNPDGTRTWQKIIKEDKRNER